MWIGTSWSVSRKKEFLFTLLLLWRPTSPLSLPSTSRRSLSPLVNPVLASSAALVTRYRSSLIETPPSAPPDRAAQTFIRTSSWVSFAPLRSPSLQPPSSAVCRCWPILLWWVFFCFFFCDYLRDLGLFSDAFGWFVKFCSSFGFRLEGVGGVETAV